ncbi:hypothetical protein ACTMU2_18025 [Cupriavidus basilensis]
MLFLHAGIYVNASLIQARRKVFLPAHCVGNAMSAQQLSANFAQSSACLRKGLAAKLPVPAQCFPVE